MKKVRLLSKGKGNYFYILVLCIYQFEQCFVNFDIVMTSKTMQYLKSVNFDVVLVSFLQLFLSVSKKNSTFEFDKAKFVL